MTLPVQECFDRWPRASLAGTLGSILIEMNETVPGVDLLNSCVKDTEDTHDRAIANAYLAKAAFRLGKIERAKELLGYAKTAAPHTLVTKIVQELEPQLRASQ